MNPDGLVSRISIFRHYVTIILSMKNYSILIYFLLLSNFLNAQTSSESPAPFSIGERVELYSESLHETRFLNIYLPHNYNPDSAIEYPVIYLLDGSAHEDFIHIAGLVQFCSYPWINHIPASIVVGIENVDRQRDFTYPTELPEFQQAIPTSGGSRAFIAFLELEVKPLIKQAYQTNGDHMLIGQSLGGLLASEILIRHPDMFDSYVIVSPSLWWDEESLLSEIPATVHYPTSVFVAVGEEGRVMKRVARQLHRSTTSRKNIEEIHFDFVKDHDHADVLHLAVYEAFRMMGEISKESE